MLYGLASIITENTMTIILFTIFTLGWLYALLWLGREVKSDYRPPYLFHVERSQKPHKPRKASGR